ncbi:MAG: auxin-binding protein, partial [Mesorhizobium sp.]
MASIWRYILAGLGLAALLVGIVAVVYQTLPHSASGPDLS